WAGVNHSTKRQHHGKRPSPADRQPRRPRILRRRSDGFLPAPGHREYHILVREGGSSLRPWPGLAVVVGRVVLPVAAAAGLAVGLYDLLRKMGFDPGRGPEQAAH